MKNILRYLCALIVVMCALPAMGQGLQIVYLKNGESIRHHITIADRTYNSRYDKENRAHASYVTYRIVLKDGYEHIYNIEDIDSIVFRSTTDESLNTAPTTDEELRESDALSIQIANSIENVHEEFEYKGNESIDDLVSAVQRISGVNSVMPNETNSSLLVEQEDGTSFAYLLNSTPDERPDYNFDKISNLLTSHVRQKAASTSGNKVVSVPKRGLILAPFQYEFNDDLELFAADIEQITGTKPKVFINAEADISKFNGDYLSQYDFIYISTHGAVLQHNMISLQTDFYTVTGTKWDKKTAEQYEARYNCRCKKLVKNGSNYIGISSNAFASYALRDKIVIVDACESMHKTGLSGTPLKDVMQANGTAFYFGNTAAVNPYMTNMYYSYFFATLCASTSIQEAAKWNSDPYFTEFWSKLSKAKKAHKEKESMPSLITYVSKDPLEPYYLKSPIPYDIETEPTNNDLSITWKSNQTSFEMDVYILNNEAEAVDIHTDEYTLKYDVYVDGTCRVKGTEENKLVLENVNSGSHEIYVVSQLFKNGFIIDTQRSEIRRISLSQPITSLTITEPTTTMTVGEVRSIEYHFEPLDPTNRTMEWSSSDPSIVRIGQDAIAYALKPGTCTLTVRTTDGSNLSATCRVTVQEEEKPQPQHYLRVYNYDYSIGADGGTVTLDYDSDVDCNLRTNVDWIVGGAGKIVTIKKNTTGDSRKGKVIIENKEYGFTETVTIIQQAGNAPEPQHYITLSESEYRVAAAGGSFTLQYQSDVACTITASENWMSVQGTKVTVSPNTTTNRRTGYVTIANDVYGLSQKVTVIQEPNEEPQHYITLTETEYHVMGTGGRFVVQYKSDVACVISSTVDWITTEGVIITVRPNNTPYRRTGYVTIVNDVYGLSQSVPVIQEPGDDAPQTDGTLLATKTVGGKSYSLFRTQDKNRRRTNPDGTSFYRSKFTLKVADQTFEIDDDVYMHEGVGDDASVCMAYNSSTRTTYMFVTSKDGDEGVYSMEGYLYAISSSGKITKNVVYTYANWGWHPFFLLSDYGDLYLASFSYAGYFYTLGYVEADGSCEFVPIDYIYPEDFQELRRREGGILVY